MNRSLDVKTNRKVEDLSERMLEKFAKSACNKYVAYEYHAMKEL